MKLIQFLILSLFALPLNAMEHDHYDPWYNKTETYKNFKIWNETNLLKACKKNSSFQAKASIFMGAGTNHGAKIDMKELVSVLKSNNKLAWNYVEPLLNKTDEGLSPRDLTDLINTRQTLTKKRKILPLLLNKANIDDVTNKTNELISGISSAKRRKNSITEKEVLEILYPEPTYSKIIREIRNTALWAVIGTWALVTIIKKK
ncbi:hypothetical protein M1446_02775 [Candidatus Dependentiae bacterium]|nr:hypothetical protein [Candidatus Dependentiae bacterium]